MCEQQIAFSTSRRTPRGYMYSLLVLSKPLKSSDESLSRRVTNVSLQRRQKIKYSKTRNVNHRYSKTKLRAQACMSNEVIRRPTLWTRHAVDDLELLVGGPGAGFCFHRLRIKFKKRKKGGDFQRTRHLKKRKKLVF